MPLDELMRKQNPDGGWPYSSGPSWTEPTVYALLAAQAAGGDEAAARRGYLWLRTQQRADGGWAPQPDVEESTWVTILAALLAPERLGEREHGRALEWLLGQTGAESGPMYRLRHFLLGIPLVEEERFPGWPWYPGTAAWVVPTALAILALGKAWRRTRAPELLARIDRGRRFLLSRMCRDGGWNHGSVRALGHESRPYPETTGLALLALAGVRAPQIGKALAVAETFLAQCSFSEGVSWLHMSLVAHGRLPVGCPARETPSRNLRDEALAQLAAAAARGHNVFLS
jgi:hypothetical protein